VFRTRQILRSARQVRKTEDNQVPDDVQQPLTMAGLNDAAIDVDGGGVKPGRATS
jgi:hypothetical protein